LSELKLVKRVEVGARAALMDTPIQICMENHEEVGFGAECYMGNAAIRIDADILLVKDAP
jgi:hypothetical protein